MSGDILKQIDSSLDDAREQFCACGCGVELRADGPSFYYATPECQSRAMRSAAIDPDAVENRTDYSYYTQDLFSAMLGDAAHARTAAPLMHVHDETFVFTQEQLTRCLEQPLPRRVRTPAEIPQWLMYQRECEHCGQCLPPSTETEYEDVQVAEFVEPIRYLQQVPEMVQSCPACEQRYAQPVISIIQRVEGGWWLRLDDRTRWVGHRVTDVELEQAIDREFLVRTIWRAMTTDLFGPNWRPTDLPPRRAYPWSPRIGDPHIPPSYPSYHMQPARAIDVPIRLDDTRRAWIDAILSPDTGRSREAVRAWLNGLMRDRDRSR
jgi:hypothetical protein